MKNDLLKQAEHYHSLGLNIFCIGSRQNIFNHNDKNLLKAPNHEWLLYNQKEQSLVTIKKLDWRNALGIGIILGYKNICAIDIDGCTDFTFVLNICRILGLPSNYEWIVESGSKTGYHIVLQCNDILQINYKQPKRYQVAQSSDDSMPFGNGDTNAYYPEYHNRIFNKIEFKWAGNLVLPESLHVSGSEYKFIGKTPTTFPTTVDFEKLFSVKNLYGSLQAEHSEVLDYVFTKQSVAKKDEERYDFNLRRIEPYILFHIKRIKIEYNEFNGLDSNTLLIQISWFVLDKNFNTIKRRIFNYYRTIEKNEEFDGSINIEKAANLITDRRHVLFEFLFDVDHAETIITHNNSFVDFVKNEVFLTGLYLDSFKKNKLQFTESATIYFDELENKEIIILDNNDTKSQLSLQDLYRKFLSKQNITYITNSLSESTINSAIENSKHQIAQSDSQLLSETENDHEDYDTQSDDSEQRTFERYKGSYAQDTEGYSDQDIDDIFDGDPDNYWNID